MPAAQPADRFRGARAALADDQSRVPIDPVDPVHKLLHPDLHLPVGWGVMDWNGLLEALRFPSDAVFMLELDKRFWPEIAAASC